MKRAVLAILAMACLAILVPVRAANVTVTVDNTSIIRTIPADFHGVNYVAFWDSAQGSAGSREALRRGGVQLIRFPGGEPGNWYDWSQESSWTATRPLDLWNYARAVGARVLFQTNPTTNAVDEAATGKINDPAGAHAAAWVSWCKSNGVDVPYWEIGNEPDISLANDYDYAALQWYFDRFNEQAQAMKAANPNITIMGPAGTNAWYWWGLHSLEMFISRCNQHADAVSLHWYQAEARPAWDDIKGAAQVWPSRMDYIRSVTGKPLYITEWTAMGGHDPGRTMPKTVGVALANADVIGAFAKTGVAGHCMFGAIHNVENNWGILAGASDYRPLDSAAPNYFVLPLWARMGDQVLNTGNTADPAAVLSVWAHRKSNGTVQVMLINKTVAQMVSINFTGYDPAGKHLDIYELKAANGSPGDLDVYYNGVPTPAVAAADLPAAWTDTCAGSIYTRTLPAYSVTVLDFGTAGPDTQAPSTPAGLSATAVSSQQIDLAWNAATDNTGVTGYKVYRGGVQIGTTPNTGYSDAGLAPNTTYSYTVAAYDAAGNTSAQSAPAGATTLSVQTMGYTGEGTASAFLGAHVLHAFRYQAGADMTGAVMKLKIASIAGARGKIKCAVYADANGQPGVFLGGTEEKAASAAGWQAFNLTVPVSLHAGGWYWLVCWTNDYKYKVSYVSGPGARSDASFTYGAWPAVFPAVQGTSESRYCLYIQS